jgi:hypothetical protein
LCRSNGLTLSVCVTIAISRFSMRLRPQAASPVRIWKCS